ncbi:MAG: hypothetical protein NTZ23_08500 [Cyanobium sp. LacPavin_0920_WC12_MAG_63_22]|nr:hypothetical protein [Cyanobium sp. LacPavin_0920_WC12_MAG_63_22]
MDQAKYYARAAVATAVLFLAYHIGVGQGRSEVEKAFLLSECVNARYSGLERLSDDAKDFLVYLAITREDKPIDLTTKEGLERYKKGSKRENGILIALRDTCKDLVGAGVTEFDNSGPNILKPEMKKVLEERWKKAIREAARKIEQGPGENS